MKPIQPTSVEVLDQLREEVVTGMEKIKQKHHEYFGSSTADKIALPEEDWESSTLLADFCSMASIQAIAVLDARRGAAHWRVKNDPDKEKMKLDNAGENLKSLYLKSVYFEKEAKKANHPELQGVVSDFRNAIGAFTELATADRMMTFGEAVEISRNTPPREKS